MQKSCQVNAPRHQQTMDNTAMTDSRPACNSTYKKLAVQWLNEALCPTWRDLVVADSFRLRNRQLFVAAQFA